MLAALWTEICLAMPAIQALGEGYDVFIVTDASGGVSAEAHDMAVRRMVAAGAVPITWMAVLGEWQRDWAREETAAGLAGLARSWRRQRQRLRLGNAAAGDARRRGGLARRATTSTDGAACSAAPSSRVCRNDGRSGSRPPTCLHRRCRMSMDRFPVGREMDVSYPSFQVGLRLLSAVQLQFEIKQGPFARTEVVDIQVVPLRQQHLRR